MATLDLIRRRPHTRAPDLAAEVGRERDPFKIDVRKLKNLGLTRSFEVGYEVSPRGLAYLGTDRAEAGLDLTLAIVRPSRERIVLLLALGLVPALAAPASAGRPIEDYASYDPPRKCHPKPLAGTASSPGGSPASTAAATSA